MRYELEHWLPWSVQVFVEEDCCSNAWLYG